MDPRATVGTHIPTKVPGVNLQVLCNRWQHITRFTVICPHFTSSMHFPFLRPLPKSFPSSLTRTQTLSFHFIGVSSSIYSIYRTRTCLPHHFIPCHSLYVTKPLGDVFDYFHQLPFLKADLTCTLSHSSHYPFWSYHRKLTGNSSLMFGSYSFDFHYKFMFYLCVSVVTDILWWHVVFIYYFLLSILTIPCYIVCYKVNYSNLFSSFKEPSP